MYLYVFLLLGGIKKLKLKLVTDNYRETLIDLKISKRMETFIEVVNSPRICKWNEILAFTHTYIIM